LETIRVKKGEILQKKGDIHTKIYIVKSGLLRSYSIDNKGKEHIFMFAPEDWIITDSTLVRQPSQLYIDALEDSEITTLKKGQEDKIDLQKILNRLNTLQKRIIMMMSATAIERYEHFIQTYPNITQRIPQLMIASYLGITPEALSKVKSNQKKQIKIKKKS